MLQLCYASTRLGDETELLSDLSDILAQARHFNAEQQIFGVLYYAEGHYFQCLQGEASVLEALFARILKDPRHHDVFRFPDEQVKQINFTEWSMKYVHKHSEIASLFNRMGHSRFKPHVLDATALKGLLNILYRVDENQAKLISSKGYKQRGYVPYF